MNMFMSFIGGIAGGIFWAVVGRPLLARFLRSFFHE